MHHATRPLTGLSRRQFLRHSVLVAGAGLVAVACQQAPTPAASGATAPGVAKPTTAPAAAAAGTPTRGGVLTWAQWDKNDLLEPASASGAAALEVIGAMTDTLI